MHKKIESFLNRGALLGGDGDLLWLGVGESRDLLPNAGVFFVTDFFDDVNSREIYPNEVLQWTREELLRKLKEYGEACGWEIGDIWQDYQEPCKQDFSEDFDQIQKGIFDGELKKAVSVVWAKFCFDFSDKGIWSLLIRLLENSSQSLIPYGYWGGGQGLLGATPEILFQSQDGQYFQSMALAGTRTGHDKDKEAFLEDPKERREHQYVVDFLEERLKYWSNGVAVGETSVLQLPHLQHLYTPVEFSFNKKIEEPSFLIDYLHPTPALGVSSETVDYQWLKRLSHQEFRGEFGAPFGFYNQKGCMKAVVSIRNIMWQGIKGRLGSGCGIVKGSRKEKEWLELLAKRQSVQKLFGEV